MRSEYRGASQLMTRLVTLMQSVLLPKPPFPHLGYGDDHLAGVWRAPTGEMVDTCFAKGKHCKQVSDPSKQKPNTANAKPRPLTGGSGLQWAGLGGPSGLAPPSRTSEPCLPRTAGVCFLNALWFRPTIWGTLGQSC